MAWVQPVCRRRRLSAVLCCRLTSRGPTHQCHHAGPLSQVATPTTASGSPDPTSNAKHHSIPLKQIKACLVLDRIRDDLCTVACNKIIEIPHLAAGAQAALPGRSTIPLQPISFGSGERPIEETFWGSHLQINSAFKPYRCLLVTEENVLILR